MVTVPFIEKEQTEAVSYRTQRREHWDNVALRSDFRRGLGGYYHKRLAEIYRFLIPPGLKVIELGCGQGDLLASLESSFAVGVDFSSETIHRGKNKHPAIHFIEADAHSFALSEKFDVIILSDLVNDLWDVQTVFERITGIVTPRSRIILNTYSRLWEIPLAAAATLGFTQPTLPQNWLTVEDLTGLLGLTDFEVIRSWSEILWPVRTPLVDRFCNRFLVKNAFFRHLALTNFIVARPANSKFFVKKEPSVSIIIPARNEAGNIPEIFQRTPDFGSEIELIFVEGHSRDETYAAIEREMMKNPWRRSKLLAQKGAGKGDAVRLGFQEARGDILMILDADLTVPPEDLPRFYAALCNAKGEFVNGVRLVYPMQKNAMRFANQIGNKFFSLAFSWLLGQPIKDTLCGTKALWKCDYDLIAGSRNYFGDFDPFGDFDLLFGAAKLNLKIVEVPVRYRERTYGTTNIQRWKHGWLLLKMVLFACRRIKYV